MNKVIVPSSSNKKSMLLVGVSNRRSMLSAVATTLILACGGCLFQSGNSGGVIVTAFALKQQQQVCDTKNQANTNSNSKNVVHTPVGKDGDGDYTASTKGCFDVIDAATPLILQEIQRQPIRPNHPFHIADLGTADAGTSLGLLTKIVKAVRARTNEEEKEIVIHYEDQKDNEWKSVFNHALGYKTVTDAYGTEIDTPYQLGNVFVEATGVGFHQQCYPRNSIDLALSFTAMHWLSTSPSSLRNNEKYNEVMHVARTIDGIPPPAEQQQAAEDWSAILQARAQELTVGGRFVCVNFGVSQEGYFLGQTDQGVSMWDSFQYAWNQLADGDAPLITEAERTGVSFPNYYRTTQEFREGIARCPSLRLISAEEKVVRCPYREQYVKNQDTETSMSPMEYAKSFVPVSSR